MDHGGQFESKDRVMSEVQVGEVDLCDNLRGPEALSTQTRNLNETNALLDGGGRGLLQKTSLSGNGRDAEEEQEEDGFTRGSREEDEEDDIDEVMKEEEEEVSEGSGSVLRCQSPDTPMTDSSYSETGSLLEAPYPLSPGTSPEPTSPVIAAVSPDTTYPISQEVPRQSQASEPASLGSTAGLVTTSEATEAEPTHFLPEHVTSSSGSHAGPTPSIPETVTVASFTTGSTTTGTESTSTAGPLASILEQITSTPVPARCSASVCTTGPTPSPALVQSLEQLAQRGDDAHLPQCLHQIAEAFVLHQDYQRALWCIQLERLYHQRVLDNLNALQEQWERKCRTSPEVSAQHLDTLRHICQTHSRPRAKDAACASVDVLTPPSDEGAALPPRSSAPQVDKELEQCADDSHLSQGSHPAIIPSSNLTDGLSSSELSGMDGGDLGRQLEGRREGCHASQPSEQAAAAAEVGPTASVTADEPHPPTAGEMDQSKPAEPQGGDLGLAQKQEAKRSEEEEEEERDVEEALEALEMEDEGEDEEEGKQGALPVETLVSGAVSEELEQPVQEGRDSQEEGAKQQREQQAEEQEEEEEYEYEYEVEPADIKRLAASLDDMAKLITVEVAPAPGLVSILKKRSVCVDNMSTSSSASGPVKTAAKRRVRFRVPDDGYEHDVGSGDSCLLLFLLCLVTVVISVGGTALYCALGDPHSSVCQDFSRNADFYMGQIQRGVSHIQHWFCHGS